MKDFHDHKGEYLLTRHLRNYHTMWQQYCIYAIEKITSYIIIHMAEQEIVLTILDTIVNWA